MAHFNDVDNAGFYSTPTVSGEFGAYPSLGQTSVSNEGEHIQTYPFAGGWGMGGQPGYVVGSPTGLRAEASFGKITTVSS